MKKTNKPRRFIAIMMLALFVVSIFVPTMSLAAVNASCSLCHEGVATQYCRVNGPYRIADWTTHSYSGGTCRIEEIHKYSDLICSACGGINKTTWHVCYVRHTECGQSDQTWCIFPDVP